MIPMWKMSGRLGNQMFQFAYLLAQELDEKIPDVYVQDPYYFDHHRDEIRAIYGKDIEPNTIDQVAIHVRRGDYVNNPFYIDLMRTSYYEEAMAEFKDAEFLVFSDDIEWCKKQDIFKDCEFATGNEVEDLNTMASCKAYIIANSSFSWWAAYLGGGKTIAPSVRNWYNDGIERTKCPKEWLRI